MDKENTISNMEEREEINQQKQSLLIDLITRSLEKDKKSKVYVQQINSNIFFAERSTDYLQTIRKKSVKFESLD